MGPPRRGLHAWHGDLQTDGHVCSLHPNRRHRRAQPRLVVLDVFALARCQPLRPRRRRHRSSETSPETGSVYGLAANTPTSSARLQTASVAPTSTGEPPGLGGLAQEAGNELDAARPACGGMSNGVGVGESPLRESPDALRLNHRRQSNEDRRRDRSHLMLSIDVEIDLWMCS